MSAGTPPGGDAQEAPSDVLDLRLVPAALLTWLVVILGLTSGWPAAAFASGAAVLAGLVAWGRMARRDPSNPVRRAHPAPPASEARTPRRDRWADGVLAAAGCVAAAGLVVAVNVAQVVRNPLRDAAAQGSAATVRVVITGDPTPLLSAASDGYGGRQAGATEVTISAELVSASTDGHRWTTGGRMLLIASRAEWASVLPGVELTASGLLSPATRADLTVAVLRVRGPPADPTEPSWWQRGADALRDGLRRAVATALPEHSAQLLPGLAIGDTGTMSWTLREDFRATGLTHLVAVSGANLVIVCGAVFGLLGLLRAGPRTRVLMALLALVGFVLLARPSPSVLRAAVMGGVGLLAVLAGRRRPVIPALAASVIGLLLVDPALGTDPGFALSVLATAALVVFAPPWAVWLRGRGVPSGVAEALAVPVAAHLVTAPVVAGFAGQVSLVAVVTNLLAAPVVAPVTVLGVLAAVVSPASATLAELCVRAAGPLVAWLVAVARWGAGVPGGAVPWPAGVGGALLLAATVGGVLMMFRHRRVRALVVAVLLGALLVLVPTRFVTPGWPVDGWSVVACDVGQGDAVVLATDQPGRAVLVDAGTEAGAVDGCLSRLRVRALSLIVISHLFLGLFSTVS